jgi:hypothetical protein
MIGMGGLADILRYIFANAGVPFWLVLVGILTLLLIFSWVLTR